MLALGVTEILSLCVDKIKKGTLQKLRSTSRPDENLEEIPGLSGHLCFWCFEEIEFQIEHTIETTPLYSLVSSVNCCS